MEIIDSKIQANLLQEFTAKYLEEHKELVEHIRETTKKQLLISGVSGMFSAEQMEQAYNDGVEAEQQRCGEFNIENYC